MGQMTPEDFIEIVQTGTAAQVQEQLEIDPSLAGIKTSRASLP